MTRINSIAKLLIVRESEYGPDFATGAKDLYYNRNRFYSPSLGRFTSRDPNETALPIVHLGSISLSVTIAPFNTQGMYGNHMSAFCYVNSNPTNAVDPTGLIENHLYPMYLGGTGPVFDIETLADHTRFHNSIRKTLGGGSWEHQREVWKTLGEEQRRAVLMLAAEEAGFDVTSSQYQALLNDAYKSADHGMKQTRTYVPMGNRHEVPRMGKYGPRTFVSRHIPGANKLAALRKGATVVSALLAAAPLLVFFDDSNEDVRQLAMSTIRARQGGGLTLWDEAFALMDFYSITSNPVAAGSAWLTWSAFLD